MLAGGHAAKPIGLCIGGVHIGVQLPLPGILITADADNAQMHVSVPGMAEADHPHTGGGFQFVDEADRLKAEFKEIIEPLSVSKEEKAL